MRSCRRPAANASPLKRGSRRSGASMSASTGQVVGIDRFGLSAPAPVAMKELGITAEAVVAAAQSL